MGSRLSGRGELVMDEEQQLCFVPLRIGVKPVGSLGLEGAVLSRETLEAVGSLIAISIERALGPSKLYLRRSRPRKRKTPLGPAG